MEGLVAYNFEPEFSEAELSEIENQMLGGENTPLPSSVEQFCSCENCCLMPTVEENVCCNESDLTVGNLDDCDCITEIPCFEIVVLDPTVLEVAFIQIMAFKGSRARAPDELTNTLVSKF
jgi:hypothetical protein